MRDLGLSLLDARTEPMAAAPVTAPLRLVTRPMPAVRPHPRRSYPPAVPGRQDAPTTLLPVVSA